VLTQTVSPPIEEGPEPTTWRSGSRRLVTASMTGRTLWNRRRAEAIEARRCGFPALSCTRALAKLVTSGGSVFSVRRNLFGRVAPGAARVGVAQCAKRRRIGSTRDGHRPSRMWPRRLPFDPAVQARGPRRSGRAATRDGGDGISRLFYRLVMTTTEVQDRATFARCCPTLDRGTERAWPGLWLSGTRRARRAAVRTRRATRRLRLELGECAEAHVQRHASSSRSATSRRQERSALQAACRRSPAHGRRPLSRGA